MSDLYKENQTLKKALRDIRITLGDFQEPWNERETQIDKIASDALYPPEDELISSLEEDIKTPGNRVTSTELKNSNSPFANLFRDE